MAKKTKKVLLGLKFIDELDMTSDEISRTIEELESMYDQKELEEGQNHIDNEDDKNQSLDTNNYN